MLFLGWGFYTKTRSVNRSSPGPRGVAPWRPGPVQHYETGARLTTLQGDPFAAHPM